MRTRPPPWLPHCASVLPVNVDPVMVRAERIPAPASYARTAAASYPRPSSPMVNVESRMVGAAKSRAMTFDVLIFVNARLSAFVDEPSKIRAPY